MLMIIGNGLISNNFKNFDHSNYIIFGSGVSDSNERNEKEFKKEESLLIYHINNFEDKKLIYFNSIMTLTNINTPYFNHKRKMVDLIRQNRINYKIYNLPQIFGNIGNDKNIVNYFINCLKKQKYIFIQKNTHRSIIDIFDIFNIIIKTLEIEQKEFNISYIELLTAKEILYIVSEVYKIKPKFLEIEEGTSINIENDKIINNVLIELEIQRINYTKNLIKKYVK